MGSLARTFVGALLTASGLVTACGHSAFDELPTSEQGLTNDSGTAPDAVANNDGPLAADGGTPFDGGQPLEDASLPPTDGGETDGGETDGGETVDAVAVDAFAGDAGCVGAACPVFVSAQAGDDANTGTAASPLQTITKGVAVALQHGQSEVRIADGVYTEDVTVNEGVSLNGGYTCSHLPCSWTAPDGTTQTQTKVVSRHSVGVQVPSNVTRATKIDNLWMTSLTGPIDTTGTFGSAAMTIFGAPMVTGCTIEAAASTGGITGAQRSVGLVIAGPDASSVGALVTNCTISASTAMTQSVGVLFGTGTTAAGSGANAVIQNSVITSGTAPQSVGVLANATSTAQLLHNTITAGVSTSISDGFSWGVMVSSPLVIDGNQINTTSLASNVAQTCVTTTAFCGGITTTTTTASIVNNWVTGVAANRSAAVFIGGSQAGNQTQVVVNSNTLNGGGFTGPNLTGGAISAAIVLSNGVPGGVVPTLARVVDNILLGGVSNARYGIYENELASTARCAALDTNDFVLPPNPTAGDVLYHVWNATLAQRTDIVTLDGLRTMVPSPTPTPTGNISANPQLSGYQIASNSPCVNAGSMTNDLPPTDIVGTPRPQGPLPDIGAFEVPK